MSRSSLLRNSVILIIAAAVARFLGVFQRIPLVHLLGNSGMSSYAIAFNLYSTLLVIATAGIPTILSKVISSKIADNSEEEAQSIYHRALFFSVISGLFMCCVLYYLAPIYARISGDLDAVYSIRAIAPALLFFPAIAVMRGYSLGNQNAMPNGISQIVEQVVRLIISILLAYLLTGYGLMWASAGASFGGVAGGMAAFLTLIYCFKRNTYLKTKKKIKFSFAGLLKFFKSSFSTAIWLIKISLPNVIFSMTVTLIYNIDTSSIIPLLKDKFTLSEAKELIGILGGQAQSLAGIPIIISVAFSQSIVPVLSALYIKKNMNVLKTEASKSLRFGLLAGLPVVLGICFASSPLVGFLFNYGGTEFGKTYSSNIVIMITISSLFQILMQTSGGILIGIEKSKYLIISFIIGVSSKIILNYILSDYFGIYGINVSTIICFILMFLFNLSIINKVVTLNILGLKWFNLILSTSIVILLTLGLNKFILKSLNLFPYEELNNLLEVVFIMAFVCVLYISLLVILKLIPYKDVLNAVNRFKRKTSKNS